MVATVVSFLAVDGRWAATLRPMPEPIDRPGQPVHRLPNTLYAMPLPRMLRYAVAALAVAGAAGCVNTTAPTGRVQLVSDLAARLDRSGSLTYTAVYAMPGGARATITQAPPRTAYTYPGGALISTPDSVASCDASSCTLTAPASPGADPAAALENGVAVKGMIVPPMVISLLTTVAMDGDALVTTHDTTLAGQTATCVRIAGATDGPAPDFEVCVTTDGVLASFSGTVGGAHIDIHLDRYDTRVAPDAFTLPAGAKVVDHRPK
jgi:hypothetical protein